MDDLPVTLDELRQIEHQAEYAKATEEMERYEAQRLAERREWARRKQAEFKEKYEREQSRIGRLNLANAVRNRLQVKMPSSPALEHVRTRRQRLNESLY